LQRTPRWGVIKGNVMRIPQLEGQAGSLKWMQRLATHAGVMRLRGAEPSKLRGPAIAGG